MYFIIIMKTIILYILVIMIYRLIGKKEINQLNIVDLIVFILIAELIASDKSILFLIIPIMVLIFIQLLLGYISYKNNKIKTLISGKPIIIIENGQLNFKEMIKNYYHLEDIIRYLDKEGIKRIEDVKYAILDRGKLIIKEKIDNYPMPIILNGNIDYFVLKKIKKDINWLNEILYENNLKLEEIFYAFYIPQKTFIIKKS